MERSQRDGKKTTETGNQRKSRGHLGNKSVKIGQNTIKRYEEMGGDLSLFRLQRKTPTKTGGKNNKKYTISTTTTTTDNIKNYDNNTSGLPNPVPSYLELNNKEERTCPLVNIAFPMNHRVKMKEKTITDKYLFLDREWKTLWNMNVVWIPILVGTVQKGLKRRLMELEIRRRINALQTTGLLRWVQVLRNPGVYEKTCCLSNSNDRSTK